MTQTDTINPAAMTVAEVARLLTAGAGRTVTAEMVQAAINAGAPVGAGGMVNLLDFTAWLEKHLDTRR